MDMMVYGGWWGIDSLTEMYLSTYLPVSGCCGAPSPEAQARTVNMNLNLKY